MTLLETITRAVSDAENLISPSKIPIVLNADEIFPNLKPDSEDPNGLSLIKRVSGWKISEQDAEIIEIATRFSKKLKRKLKNPKSLDRDSFLGLLDSFLKKNGEKINFSVGCDASDPDFTRVAIGKLGFLISQDVLGLIIEACLVLELWEVLESMILQEFVGRLNSTNLIEKLVEKNRLELLGLCVKHISDLRASELLAVLKCFLSPSRDSYSSVIVVRKEWESQALLAIEKATQKGLHNKVSDLAKEASVLLMMAHDGFSSAELCLHYVFGSSNLDELVLSSAISRLDGSEVLGLVRYFVKWFEKYQRFPEAGPCPSAGSVLGLRACECVPSLESVVTGLGLVLDVHFSYLVLNSDFHGELRSIEKVVNSMASEADLCCPVASIIEALRSEVKHHGGL